MNIILSILTFIGLFSGMSLAGDSPSCLVPQTIESALFSGMSESTIIQKLDNKEFMPNEMLHFETCQEAILKSPNERLKGDDFPCRPIHITVAKNKISLVGKLREMGVSISKEAHDQMAPITLATKLGSIAMVGFLLDLGAKREDSAEYLIRYARYDLLEFFLKKKINPKTLRSRPLIVSAAQNGLCSFIQLLHDYGADLDEPSDSGSTALYLASRNGMNDAVKLLCELGAKKNVTYFEYYSQKHLTPEDVARTPEIKDIIRTDKIPSLVALCRKTILIKRILNINYYPPEKIAQVPTELQKLCGLYYE